METDDKIKKLSEWVHSSRRIVFFGGAGVSTESGLKDFRGTDGLYAQQYDVPPERILSDSYFWVHGKEFWRFYGEKLRVDGIKPNAAHKKLAQWEKEGILSAIVTQNIDGLHQAAGSSNVYELHGSVHRNHCTACGKFFGYDAVKQKLPDPVCECGGRIKPDVVLYGEPLDETIWQGAVRVISDADMLIVGGTSLTVYPAASLIRYFRGDKLVLINKTETASDGDALVIREPIGRVLSRVD